MGQGYGVKRGLTIGLAIAAVGITYSYVSARSLKGEATSFVTADTPAPVTLKPPSEIVDTVREMGLIPNSEVLRRGPYYVLHALDTHGVELRVVADAHFGDILSVRLAQPYSLVPDYVRAPRIIHVPPPRRPIKPRLRHRADDSPPPRAVKSAPPTDALLTPIRPTPNLRTKTKAAEKSGPPLDAPPPPSGSAPPKVAPGGR